MVPHLITALNGPINELEQRILDSVPAIERWFRLEWMEHTPPFYSSANIRNAGFKVAPMGTSLYPRGWNNLTPEMVLLAVQAAQAAIEKICPEAGNLLLIPENHSHDTFYLANVAQLVRIFQAAGLNARIGSIDPAIKSPKKIELPDGQSVVLEPVMRSKHRLSLKDFNPCTILLNNGLAAGIPGILEDLHEQYLLPPLHASWPVRRKSNHFRSYEEVAKRFGKLLGIDPWLIAPMTAQAQGIDFARDNDLDVIATHCAALLTKIRRKYKEYGISEKPFVVIKPDGSSQGAGVITVRHPAGLMRLDHETRARMSACRSGEEPGDFLIQEGLPTCERVHDNLAEPVVYMIDRYVVGGFYRVRADRETDESFNASGASFVPLAFSESVRLPQSGAAPGVSPPNRFYMYGVLARLGMAAASHELEATDPDVELYE